jgi:hypothetical protein
MLITFVMYPCVNTKPRSRPTGSGVPAPAGTPRTAQDDSERLSCTPDHYFRDQEGHQEARGDQGDPVGPSWRRTRLRGC